MMLITVRTSVILLIIVMAVLSQRLILWGLAVLLWIIFDMIALTIVPLKYKSPNQAIERYGKPRQKI